MGDDIAEAKANDRRNWLSYIFARLPCLAQRILYEGTEGKFVDAQRQSDRCW